MLPRGAAAAVLIVAGAATAVRWMSPAVSPGPDRDAEVVGIDFGSPTPPRPSPPQKEPEPSRSRTAVDMPPAPGDPVAGGTTTAKVVRVVVVTRTAGGAEYDAALARFDVPPLAGDDPRGPKPFDVGAP